MIKKIELVLAGSLLALSSLADENKILKQDTPTTQTRQIQIPLTKERATTLTLSCEDYLLSGFFQLVSERYENAIEDFESAIKLNSKCPEAYFYKGFSLYKLGKTTESLSNYNISIDKLNLRDPIAYTTRAEAFIKMGNRKMAEEDFKKAKELKERVKDRK